MYAMCMYNYIPYKQVVKSESLYRKWDINGRLTSQPVLNKPRAHGNEIIDLRLRHFFTGITCLSGPDLAASASSMTITIIHVDNQCG